MRLEHKPFHIMFSVPSPRCNLQLPKGLDVVKSVWSDAPLVVVEGDWMTLQPISVCTGACETAGIVATFVGPHYGATLHWNWDNWILFMTI